MSNQKYVCIDLDGTIAHYEEWKGETHFGEPIEGVQEALNQISYAGWKIIIFTTRANRKLVAEYLQSHSIIFDYHQRKSRPTPKCHRRQAICRGLHR